MVFKRNITITIACVFTEFLLSLTPAAFIIYIFFEPQKVKEIFNAMYIIPLFICISNLVFYIISLIFQIFMKTKFYVNKDSLIIKEKEKVKEIHYNEIKSMTYDFGEFSKFNSGQSRFVLFGENFNELLVINNPSIIMVHLIKKRCKTIKMNYYNNKRFLWIFTIFNIVFILGMIIIKLSS